MNKYNDEGCMTDWMKHYNNCAKAPLADTISVLSYESEKQRLDKKLEKQKKEGI